MVYICHWLYYSLSCLSFTQCPPSLSFSFSPSFFLAVMTFLGLQRLFSSRTWSGTPVSVALSCLCSQSGCRGVTEFVELHPSDLWTPGTYLSALLFPSRSLYSHHSPLTLTTFAYMLCFHTNVSSQVSSLWVTMELNFFTLSCCSICLEHHLIYKSTTCRLMDDVALQQLATRPETPQRCYFIVLLSGFALALGGFEQHTLLPLSK